MSYSQKAFSGFLNSFSYTLLSKVITVVGGIYLARLLSPHDYGLIAMLYIFFEASDFLIDGGFGLSLVREKDISEEDKTTAFYFNLMMGIGLYAIIWIASPAIAHFYNEPKLIMLSRVMGLNFIFASFGLVQRAVFKRSLKFKQLGIIQTIAFFLTNATAIVLAYCGAGVLALAVKFTITNLVTALMLYGIMPWKPTGFINKESFKKLFTFGANVMMLGLVDTVSKNVHKVVIGKVYTTSVLGHFNQGVMLRDNIITPFNTSIIGVSFPILAQLQNEKERLKEAYVRLMKISCYLIFPIITLLIIFSEPLVIVLLGPKWRGTIIFLQILACTGYVKHLHNINLNVLKVYGKGKDYLTQGIIRNGMVVLALIASVNISVLAMAWSLVIVEFLQLFVNVYYSNKYIKFAFSEQLNTMLPIIVLNVANAALLFFIAQLPIDNYFLKYGLIFIVFCIFYIGSSIVFKMHVYYQVRDLLLNKLRRKKSKKTQDAN